MVRFFRNIRQRLLENGNLRKYFWYAVGEVFLVVIGILIALQINNWNELRKINTQKKALLTNVQTDLRNDLRQLVIVRNDIIEKDQLGMYLMSYFNSDKHYSEFDEDKLRLGFMNAIDIQEFDPNRLGYRELLSTGIVNRIEDNSLKALLFDHYEISVRENFDFRQRERYDITVADGRFAYIPNLTLREKIKSGQQIGDWKEDPYEDLTINWAKVRSDGVFPMYLGRLLALHLATISNLDEVENNIEQMLLKIEAEIQAN